MTLTVEEFPEPQPTSAARTIAAQNRRCMAGSPALTRIGHRAECHFVTHVSLCGLRLISR